jgi:hypothetical protein
MATKLSETEAAAERAVLGLAETKDRTFRVESEVASLRAVKFEELRL